MWGGQSAHGWSVTITRTYVTAYQYGVHTVYCDMRLFDGVGGYCPEGVAVMAISRGAHIEAILYQIVGQAVLCRREGRDAIKTTNSRYTVLCLNSVR